MVNLYEVVNAEDRRDIPALTVPGAIANYINEVADERIGANWGGFGLEYNIRLIKEKAFLRGQVREENVTLKQENYSAPQDEIRELDAIPGIFVPRHWGSTRANSK